MLYQGALRLDVREDASRIRTGNTPRVMATLQNVSVSLLRIRDTTNIAAALRHNARKNRRISNSWSFYQPKHSNADFAVPVITLGNTALRFGP